MQVANKLVLAALLLSGSQAAILADEPGQARSATIGYADLNLAADDGVAVFMTRIHLAAKEVCGGTPLDTTLAVEQSYRNCHQVAMDSVMPQVHAAIDHARDKAHVDIHEAYNDTGTVELHAPAVGASN